MTTLANRKASPVGLHAAVIGTGDWARVHLTALAASPHVEAVTLCGRNATRRAALAADFPIVRKQTADLSSVLSDESTELVQIVLPHYLHATTAQAALAAGKHVILEKPGATKLADFEATVSQAERSGRRLLIVMNQLHNPVFLRLERAVREGLIGRPFLSVENSFRDASTNYRRLDYWRNTPDQAGGGVLIDGGFHMVYRHLHTLSSCGLPDWVMADTPQLNVRKEGSREPRKGEDFASLVIGYPSALRIQLAHGWTLAATPERSRQSFLAGTEGTLELTDRAEEPLVLRSAQGVEPIAAVPGPRNGAETTHACLLDYLEAIAIGRELPENLPLARQTLTVILAAYEAGRSGERVSLSPGDSP